MVSRSMFYAFIMLAVVVLTVGSGRQALAAEEQPLVVLKDVIAVDSPDATMRVTVNEWGKKGEEAGTRFNRGGELRWRVDRLVDGEVTENILPETLLTTFPGHRYARDVKTVEDPCL